MNTRLKRGPSFSAAHDPSRKWSAHHNNGDFGYSITRSVDGDGLTASAVTSRLSKTVSAVRTWRTISYPKGEYRLSEARDRLPSGKVSQALQRFFTRINCNSRCSEPLIQDTISLHSA